MRIPFRGSSAARSSCRPRMSSVLALSSLAVLAQAINITSVPSAGLDLSNLGSVGIAGDYTGISLYQYVGQNEQPFFTNGSQSLLSQLPNGMLLDLLDTDAFIQTMCLYGDGVVLGGNFTSLGGQQSAAISIYNLTTSTLTPVAGLSGQVNALLCDPATSRVYVGGSFRAANSTNAITWLATGGWASLPFEGFNGPVTSIAKAASGHIVFGGSFTGLGNTSTPREADGQVINLSSASIAAQGSSATAGFNGSNIICKTSGADGAGNTWLLEDNTPGSWQADFSFGFEPTKLRLWNTRLDGRGTKTWRLTALPLGGIMNFTYVDPATGQNASCTNMCPLSNDPSVPFQDFHFVNQVGMNSLRVDISDWYGSGGGLDGIELFEDDIFVYAINDFNEPSCANLTTPSKATSTGPWTVTSSGSSNSEYLSAQLSSPITKDSASVVFFPDIRQSGDYIIKMYTPGCRQDNTCSNRGQVNVTGTLSAKGAPSNLAVLYQTNDFDKYDQVWIGAVDASSGSFRPTITMTPVPGQSLSNLTMVAQRVGFELINSTGGLNGLFEYDPTQASVNTSDFTSSAFDKLGASFSTGSAVTSLITDNDVVYIGGNFSSSSATNIVGVNTKDGSTITLDGGLNGQILSMSLLNNKLYAGGSFNSTLNGSTSGLSHVAAYDTQGNAWSPLGAGVDGPVTNVVPMSMNISGSTTPESVITLTGNFHNILAFGKYPSVSVNQFAIWVPSQNNWLVNLDGQNPVMQGILSTSLLSLPGGVSLYAGSMSSQALRANGAATLGSSLGVFPLQFLPSTSSKTSSSNITKRAALAETASTASGVLAGAFYNSGNNNVTILGGHFTANTTNGTVVQNLVFIDGANSNTVTGIGSGVSSSSVFLALAVTGDTLFAGGQVNGTVHGTAVDGLISYNIPTGGYTTQPPALGGKNVVVAAIKIRPNTGDAYVGGSFDTAGSLPCPGVCVFTSASQWNRPGLSLGGSVYDMFWSTDSTLIVGGNLTVNGATTYLATYDAPSTTWKAFNSASSLPGPVYAVTAGSSDGSQVWATGSLANGSVYLMKYDGSTWVTAGTALLPDTVVSSLQVFPVSSSHSSTSTLSSNEVLVLTGSIDIPGYGLASAAVFNGIDFEPFALTTTNNNTAGSIARIFVQNQSFFTPSSGGLAVGFVVLIGLGISLGLMLLLVVAGLALDRYRKKRDGYVPAPTSMFDRGSGMQRIPPHELLDSLNKGRPGVPRV